MGSALFCESELIRWFLELEREEVLMRRTEDVVYILQEQRPELDAIIDQFPELNDGQLNYVFTHLAH